MNTTVSVHRVIGIKVEPRRTFSTAFSVTLHVYTDDGVMEISLFSQDGSAFDVLKESQE